MKNGLAIIAPSGTGKATICECLIGLRPDLFVMAPSACTREAKEERHGKKYLTLTFDVFEQMIREGKFLEYNKYPAKNERGYNYYGTLKEDYEKIVASGKVPLLDIDVEGVVQCSSFMTVQLFVFALICEIEEIETRLRERGSESDEQIAVRLDTGKKELAKYPNLKRIDIIHELIAYGAGKIPGVTANEILNKFLAVFAPPMPVV